MSDLGYGVLRKPWIFGTSAVAVREHYREQERHQETGIEMRTCPPNKEQAGVSLLAVLVIP